MNPNWIAKFAGANLLSMVIVGAAGGHKAEWSQARKDRLMKGQIY